MTKRARLFQVIQGPLVAVSFGILFQMIASHYFPSLALEASHLVNLPMIDGLSGISEVLVFPAWGQMMNGAVFVTAITIAVVASLETLLCVEATDKMDPIKRVTPTK